MEITLQDIARELDVSQATVSRSLRHDTLINAATRARVNEAAQRMGYKTRSRRPRRALESESGEVGTRTLGLLLRHASVDAMQQDRNLLKMMSGIMAVADAERVLFQMHTLRHEEHSHMNEGDAALPPIVKSGLCQAFLVHGEQDERDLAFLAGRAPVVSLGRLYRALPIDAAVGDNVEGVQTLVTHLVELGHRRLAWVGTGLISSFMQARQAGFVQGCLQHGLEFGPASFYGPEISREEHLKAPNGLLAALQTSVTAFVCGNDYLAQRLTALLQVAGRAVPDEISVTGFDNSPDGDYFPRPTSIDPHFFEIGQVAAQLAIQRMAHPMRQPSVVSVRGELVQGDTTAPCAASTRD